MWQSGISSGGHNGRISYRVAGRLTNCSRTCISKLFDRKKRYPKSHHPEQATLRAPLHYYKQYSS